MTSDTLRVLVFIGVVYLTSEIVQNGNLTQTIKFYTHQ